MDFVYVPIVEFFQGLFSGTRYLLSTKFREKKHYEWIEAKRINVCAEILWWMLCPVSVVGITIYMIRSTT
jgi:hypothetical protein